MCLKIGRSAVAPLSYLLAAVSLFAPATQAETLATFNGQAMDSELLDIYMQNRVQKPLEQLTAQERASLTSELENLFVLSTGELAKEVEKDPDIAAQLKLQHMAILSRFVAQRMAESIDVSDEEVQAMYQEQIKLSPSQQYKARHILLESQGEAVAVIEELLAGADFEALAKERSTGPSGPNGGDLGWFTPDQMVPAFSQAVMKLQDGRYTTDPVQTQFGWHVILREESRAAEPPPLDSVKDNVEARVRQQKLIAAIDAMKKEAKN